MRYAVIDEDKVIRSPIFTRNQRAQKREREAFSGANSRSELNDDQREQRRRQTSIGK